MSIDGERARQPGASDAADDVPDAPDRWTASGVRKLRDHLGLSQAELAERIGTRQQTISEWETGASNPRRMSRRLLGMVAEESGYYRVSGGVEDERTAAEPPGDSSVEPPAGTERAP